MKARAAVILLAVFGVVCGSGGSPDSPDGPLGRLAVGGTYAITRAYVLDTCAPGDIVDADAPVTGTVTHSAGAARFSLANADGGRFSADLHADASFTSGTQQFVGANGVRYAQLFEGRFGATGFSATVTVDLFRAQGACRAVLDWRGAKQGAPNVLG
jgi:hypothetical protein